MNPRPANARPGADDRPHYATTNAGWLRLLVRVMGLVIMVALSVFLLGAGRSALAEGERLALELAEQNLRNLVWLEGKRVAGEEGVEGLQRRAGGDPRAWAKDRIAAGRPGDAPAGALPAWADDRWRFDPVRGELVYTPTWMPGGPIRWKVVLQVDGVDSSTPGLARDLLLVRASP